MAVSYPSNPSTGDIFTISNVSYYYDGADWVLLSSITIDPAINAVQSTGSVTIDNLTVTGTLTADVDVAFDTNTFFVDSDLNRVGINQQSPQYALDVTGQGRFTAGIIGDLTGDVTGNADTASTLETARTISLTGSVTGSGSFDGSGNLDIATTTNHTHSYLPLSGGTLTGTLTVPTELTISEGSPQIHFEDTDQDDFWIHINSNNFYVLADRDGNGSWETPHPLQLEADTNTSYTFGNRILTVADEGSGNGLDADTVDGSHASAFATSDHNHTYNVNNAWLRDNGDNAHVKLYGNSRQMVFRTDGNTEYASGVSTFAFLWMYGGDSASNRRMGLNTSGQLWTSNYGYLHDYFADINFQTHSRIYDNSNVTGNGNYTVTLSSGYGSPKGAWVAITMIPNGYSGFADVQSYNSANYTSCVNVVAGGDIANGYAFVPVDGSRRFTLYRYVTGSGTAARIFIDLHALVY